MAFSLADLCAAAVALFMAVPMAHAQTAPMEGPAREHFERARSRFEQRDYDAAIEEFRAGYRLQPHGDFLYGIAQAERLRGNCRAAVDAYRAFLATAPPESEARLAKGHIERCEQELAPRTPPRPRRKPKPKPQPKPDPIVPEDHWYQDPPGHVLCALGLGAVGVGVGLLAVGEARARATHDSASWDEFEDAQRDAKTLRIAAPITLAAGGALFVGGVVRFATFSSESRNSAFVWLTGSF